MVKYDINNLLFLAPFATANIYVLIGNSMFHALWNRVREEICISFKWYQGAENTYILNLDAEWKLTFS